MPVPRPLTVCEGFSALAAISESAAWLPLLRTPPYDDCRLVFSSDQAHWKSSFPFQRAKLPSATRISGGFELVCENALAPAPPRVRLQNEIPVRLRLMTSHSMTEAPAPPMPRELTRICTSLLAPLSASTAPTMNFVASELDCSRIWSPGAILVAMLAANETV